MKNIWLRLILICILISTGVIPTYAQEATTYATVLIIIPERTQIKQAQSPTEELKEKDINPSEKDSEQEKITLAKSQKEEIKTSEEAWWASDER